MKLPNKPKCPKCEAVLDGFQAFDEAGAPGHDDLSICVYCGAINQFAVDEDGVVTIVPADPEVAAEIDLLDLFKQIIKKA